MFDCVILTCEHATNFIPSAYDGYFTKDYDILNTHRGYDIGADEIAGLLSEQFGLEYYKPFVSRLLIDCNRSLDNESLISTYIAPIDLVEKESIVAAFYKPYRDRVVERFTKLIENDKKILHLSIHSFTPVLDGVERSADIGVLYDPDRGIEQQFSEFLINAIVSVSKGYIVKTNYPYKGTDDGFTTFLRSLFTGEQYCGIEVEINQKIVQSPVLYETIKSALDLVFARFCMRDLYR